MTTAVAAPDRPREPVPGGAGSVDPAGGRVDVVVRGHHRRDRVACHPLLTVVAADAAARAHVLADLAGRGAPHRVVRTEDLPLPAAAADERGVAEVLAARADRAAARAALHDAVRWHEAAVAAHAVGQDEVVAAAAAVADAEAVQRRLVARPEQLVRDRAALVEERRRVLGRRATVVELAQRVEALVTPGGPLWRLRGGSSGEVGDPVGDEAAELLAAAGAAGVLAPERAALAGAWLDAVRRGEAPVRPDAAELLDAAHELDRRWDELAGGVEADPEVVAVLAERDRFVAILAALTERARDGVLVDRARAEIEAAHDAAQRTGHRAAGGDGEAEVLERYGFESYLDYTIAVSTRSVDGHIAARIDEVELRLRAIGDRLDAARAAAATRRTELAAERTALAEAAAAVLGERPDGPLEPALRAVPAVPEEVLGAAHEAAAAVAATDDDVAGLDAALAALDHESATLGARTAAGASCVADLAARHDDLSAMVDALGPELAASEVRLAERRADAAAAEAAASAAFRRWVAEAGDGARHGPADLPAVVAALCCGDVPVVVDEVCCRGAEAVGSAFTGALGAALVTELAATLAGGAAAGARRGGPQVVVLTDDPVVLAHAATLDPGAAAVGGADRGARWGRWRPHARTVGDVVPGR